MSEELPKNGLLVISQIGNSMYILMMLRPSLFILYVNDMCNVSSLLKSILFADDTSCFLEGSDLPMMCNQLSTEMNKMSVWFKVNKLSLNLSKTNYMVFGNTNTADQNCNVSIDNVDVDRVSAIVNSHGMII